MKILVLSDSHGKVGMLESIMNVNADADVFIFLGDGENDFARALKDCRIPAEKTVIQVQGNCDHTSRQAVTLVRNLGGINFYITHGFEQRVKWELEKIYYLAQEKHCQVALFGHTHKPLLERAEDIMLFNPGSVMGGCYGIIYITDGNIEFENRVVQF